MLTVVEWCCAGYLTSEVARATNAKAIKIIEARHPEMNINNHIIIMISIKRFGITRARLNNKKKLSL